MTRRQAAATRLYDGSAIVARRVGASFVPENRPIAATVRVGGGIYVAAHMLGLLRAEPLWVAIGAGAWCIAAWRADADGEATAEKPTQTAEPARPRHSDAEIHASAVHELRALIGDRNGVHLAEVLADWQKRGWVGQVSAAELGRQLVVRGIPVRASLKVAGQVGPGVHRDDLPALSQPLPDRSPVAATG